MGSQRAGEGHYYRIQTRSFSSNTIPRKRRQSRPCGLAGLRRRFRSRPAGRTFGQGSCPGQGLGQYVRRQDLKGWKANENDVSFTVKNGCIVANAPGRCHLFYETKKPFKNFEFKAQVMTLPHSPSGIYFHTRFQDEGWPKAGFECLVNNTYHDPKKTASVYGVKDTLEAPARDDEWFEVYIKVEGKKVVTKVNGKTIVEWTQPDDWKAGSSFEENSAKAPSPFKDTIPKHGFVRNLFVKSFPDPKENQHETYLFFFFGRPFFGCRDLAAMAWSGCERACRKGIPRMEQTKNAAWKSVYRDAVILACSRQGYYLDNDGPRDPRHRKPRKERLKDNKGLPTVVVLSKVSLRALQIDPKSGKVLQNAEIFEKKQPQWVHKLNSYASPTPVIEDGKVYFHFGAYGNACIDAKRAKFRKTTRSPFGSCTKTDPAAPLIWDDLMIFHLDGSDKQNIVALYKDRKNRMEDQAFGRTQGNPSSKNPIPHPSSKPSTENPFSFHAAPIGSTDTIQERKGIVEDQVRAPRFSNWPVRSPVTE